MLRNFLSALLLLFLMSCAMCHSTSSKTAVKEGTPFVLFKPDTIQFKENGASATKQFESFTFPSLNYVKNVLVVVAQAKDKGKKCDIVEGHFKFESVSDLTGKLKEPTESHWTMQVVTKDNTQEYCKGNPTTVVSNAKLYVFFNSSDKSDSKLEYGFINDEITESKVNGDIKWSAFNNLKNEIKFNTKGPGDNIFVASGGSGIVVNNSFFVPLWYQTKDGNDFISAIINSIDTTNKKWNLVTNDSFAGEKYPAVVEWNKKVIMMTSCNKGFRRVYEYDEIKKLWTEAVGSLSGVWGNTERKTDEYGGKNGFITADIKEKGKVMLLAQPVAQPVTTSAKRETENDHKLHLWMTDNKRVFDAGEISAEVGKEISSTLLFAKEILFAAYETWHENKATINVVYLKDQLEKIKEVLEKWKQQDDELSKSCFGTDGTITSGGKCTANISTIGLVGFLSDEYKNHNWVDKYMCVNATVKLQLTTVTKETNGLNFNGAGAGATWPVGDQGQNQRYHFANHAFTLIATVKIDNNANKNKNSILGIGLEGGSGGQNKKSIGLWCTAEGKWEISGKENAPKTTEEKCNKDTTYQVALSLQEQALSVYIDGKKIELTQSPITIKQEEEEKITHFYFGVDNFEGRESQATTAAESHATVTNVLLYNRPFERDEIKNIKEHIKPVEVIKPPAQNVDTNTTGSSDEQPTTLPTVSDEKKEEGKEPSPSRTEDGSVGGGVRVFSLLLAVLCVSAPLLHL